MKKLVFLFLFIGSAVFAADSIQLADIFVDFKFYPRSVRGIRSMDDGKHFTKLTQNAVNKHEYETGEKVAELLNLSELEDMPYIHEYTFNSNESKLLLATNVTQQYRHSYFADYYIYDIESKELVDLNPGYQVMRATFSPDGKKIAYVYNNNIYYYSLETKEHTQVTTDGKFNEIINGTTDWVYEEEFAFTEGFHWSPKSDKIAFFRFDESRVKEFTMQYYGELYPQNYTFKYPKAGEQNSLVEIWFYELESGEKTKADIGEETDIYIPRIKWTQDNSKLAIMRLNRLQNISEVLLTDSHSGESKVIFRDENPYYISEIDDDYVTFLKDGMHFVIKSEKDGFMHLYRYTLNGDLVNQITKGKWDVTDFYGIDEENNELYYQSSEGSAIERQVYKVGLDGTSKTKLSTKNGINTATFSKDFSYYIHTFTDHVTPKITTLFNKAGEKVRVLEENSAIKDRIQQHGFAEREFMTIKTENNIDLNGYVIKPTDFDENKEYPLLMFVYGGPESQEALNEYMGYWDAWFNYLAQQGFIVACFDNRGTDARGQEFRKATYMQLGKLEAIDQINVAKALGAKPYIDQKRIGIMGWSYGGYLSSLCLFTGADVFALAIAIAPVTNWRYYDTIYTERFMRTPQENASGYDDNSPVNHAHKMNGKFLLIHGMADDNVHLQNAVDLSEELIRNNKDFEMLYYPNRNHGIRGNGATIHLFTKVTDFITSNLN
jgi:dipeptidyl-peptidase-4